MPCDLDHGQGYYFNYEVDFAARNYDNTLSSCGSNSTFGINVTDLPSQTLTLRAFQTVFGQEAERK